MARNVPNALQIIFITSKNFSAKNVLKTEFMINQRSSVCALLRNSSGLVNNAFPAITLNISIVKKWIASFVLINKCMMLL